MSFSIRFDYRYDDDGFFDDPERRAILDLAANEWARHIQDEFDDIPAGAVLSVVDPENPSQSLTVELSEPIDDLLIFVGSNDQGGWVTLPDGSRRAQIGEAYSVYGGDGDAMRLRNAFDFRGLGPTTDYEPFVGSIAFNDNPEIEWSFDPDGPVSGLSDLYSTAVHEIGHILGLLGSPTAEALVSSNGFTGFNAQQENGGAPIPLESDDYHVLDGFAGDTIVMDPLELIGTRKLPGSIDLAMLADIGYEIDGYVKQGTPFALTTDGDDNPVFGSQGGDVIDGLAGDDWIQGEGGNDNLSGGDGIDTLFGGSGSDTLDGDDGEDQIQGNTGEDLINGGPGDDDLFGGDDYDTYVFEGDWGDDFILDPDPDGRVRFIGYAESELSFSPSGSNLFITAGANRVILFDYYTNGSSYDFAFDGSADTVREGTDTSAVLADGVWQSGTIDAEPIAGDGVTSDLAGGFVDKDWYRLTLDEDRIYSFDAQSLSLTTGLVFVRLYDSAGNEIGGSFEAEGAAPSFAFSTAGQSGSQTYYLAISAGDTNDSDFRIATGDFQVRFTDNGPVTTTDTAANTSTNATLSVGGTVFGEIQQDDVSSDYIDADYFRVTLTGGQRYTFSADAGVDGSDTLDEVFMRLRDAMGNTLSPDIRNEGAAPEFVFDAPGSGQQTYYFAISAGGSGAWWDDTGAYSVSLSAEGAVPQPVNYRPVAEATDYRGDPGDVVPLTDLFSYRDPDGLSDIVSFAVQDRTSLGGHLTYLGQQMDPNEVYERPIGQIGDWAFVVGPPGTDYIGFNAIDSEGAFNTSVVAAVSGAQEQGSVPASAEDLFGQQKLSTLAKFAQAAYPKYEAALTELEQDGWSVIEWIDPSDAQVKYFENQNASALAAEAPDGKSIVLAITGTNSAWDRPEDQKEWFDMPAHYEKLAPFFGQLNLSNYDAVYVTGHSLGAAMTEAFIIDQAGDRRFEGVAFANPGFNSFEVPQLPNMSSFVIEGDIIRVPDLVPAQIGGKEISGDEYVLKNSLFSDVVSTAPRATALKLHEVELYVEAADSLDRSSPFILENQYNLAKDERPYSIYLESLLIGSVEEFFVAGSPIGSVVTPTSVLFGQSPGASDLDQSWIFSTDNNDLSTLTIDASAYTNTDWTIGADGADAVLSDLARQELLRSSGFESLQINSSWADLDLTIEELEGTSILNNTVYVSAGIGNDSIDGTPADRRIVATGGDGDDTLIGGSPDDHFSGEVGNDTLNGGGGDDVLDGGPGDDTFTGGAGDDTFIKRPGESDDTITDFEKGTGPADGDKIDVSAYGLTFDQIGFETQAGGLQVRLGSDSILLEGVALARLDEIDFQGLVKDSDGDLVPDNADNAIFVANPDQRDSNGDDYGNVIDADLTNDGVIDVEDLLIFRRDFGSTGFEDGVDAAADADFDGNGAVDVDDLLTFRDLFGQPLGASYVEDQIV